MNLKTTKFAILIISILLISCENTDKLKEKPDKEKISISEEFKTETKAKEVEIIQTSKVLKNQIERINKSVECFLSKEKSMLPKIREVIGDTINIKKIYDWVLTLEKANKDEEIRKIINRGGKFFLINETEKFTTIGFLEDEGEYLGIYAYSISKENCKILGKELLAEKTAWENGYKESFSIIKDNFTIKREKHTGAKNWGDHTKWKRDTIISMINFSEKGQINLKKR